MQNLDLEIRGLREVNQTLQSQSQSVNQSKWAIANARGNHAIAVGLDAPIEVTVNGSTILLRWDEQAATININGSAGPGVAENMMSGKVVVEGDASQYAGATGRGGLLVIKGNASSRCGISMKGISIVVHGNIGHVSGFMAQSGTLVACGDAEDAQDSIYEAQLFVRGSVKSLGADCVAKEMRTEHLEHLRALLSAAGCNERAEDFTRYGSARNLYHFDVDNSGVY